MVLASKSALIAQFNDGTVQFPSLGAICWWNIRNVSILREKLIEVLKACGIDEKFARVHNYRAAFIRSLKEMEENRIIRLVEENSAAMVYQFTTETKIDQIDVKLQYDPETLVVVDKIKYRATKVIEDCISGRADIRQKLIDLFDEKKDKYHSSDITRLIQRIFAEKADIISLRETGGVYFVPSEFQNILQAVAQFVNSVGGSSFEHFPLPDVEACRTVVANAANNEMMVDLKKMDEEMQLVEKGEKEVTGKWHDNKAKEIEKLKKRIDRYLGLLSDGAAKHLTDNYEKMKEAILKPRNLDI